MLHKATRAQSEHDAVVLCELYGRVSYGDLPVRTTRQELDQALDRMLSLGYISWTFQGRLLTKTEAGSQAVRRAFARPRRRGVLPDAAELYPPHLRKSSTPWRERDSMLTEIIRGPADERRT